MSNTINDDDLARCIKIEREMDAIVQKIHFLEEMGSKLELILKNCSSQPIQQVEEKLNCKRKIVICSNTKNGPLIVPISVYFRQNTGIIKNLPVYKIDTKNGFDFYFTKIAIAPGSEKISIEKIYIKKDSFYSAIPAYITQKLKLKAGQILEACEDVHYKFISFRVI